MSARVYNNGEKRWLCNGTSFESSDGNKKTTNETRVCSSYQSQRGRQQIGKFDVVCDKQRPQKLRKWKTYKTTLAKIEPITYTGILFCPNVSTGCFVARRNGKVFITGNSGFPKSHDVGLYIDKKLGCPDRGHRFAVANRNHPDGTLEPNGENLPRYEDRTELGRAWTGWGTALKPAYEPIIMARKALYKTVADNVMTYGCGGINIDECRVGDETVSIHNAPAGSFAGGERNRGSDTNSYRDSTGRFPANVIHDGSEEVVAGMPDTKGGDEGSASRYFYCAKASSKDRDEGLDNFEKKNIHPTVKPCALMQYLVRLVTPKGGTVLDPFNGSGSTGKAVAFENRERDANYKYIGIELDKEYCKISEARINYALHKYEYEAEKVEADKQEPEQEQLNLFDFMGDEKN